MIRIIIIIIIIISTTYLFPSFSSNFLLHFYVPGKTMSIITYPRLDIMLNITGF
jgi:hypothetical protein